MSNLSFLDDAAWELQLVPAEDAANAHVLPPGEYAESERLAWHFARSTAGVAALRALLARQGFKDVSHLTDRDLCRRVAEALLKRSLVVTVKTRSHEANRTQPYETRLFGEKTRLEWLEIPLIIADSTGHLSILNDQQIRVERGDEPELGWRRLPVRDPPLAEAIVRQIAKPQAGLAWLKRLAAQIGQAENDLLEWAEAQLLSGGLKILYQQRYQATAPKDNTQAKKQSYLADVSAAIARASQSENAARPDKTWIEIELVDSLGTPVPNEPYELVLAGGRTVRGRLDARGQARLDGIDPGECKLTFPEIDGREWAAA